MVCAIKDPAKTLGSHHRYYINKGEQMSNSILVEVAFLATVIGILSVTGVLIW